MTTVKTTPFPGQKPGTSGLRKTVQTFKQRHYLENFIQAIFDSVPNLRGQTLILGGDGRYHNDTALQTILKMAAANGIKHVMVGRNGLLSTPAASNLIRKYKAGGGIILSASHNPGGPDGDFGIKFNAANGGPAPEILTNAIYARTQVLSHYKISDKPDINLENLGDVFLGEMRVEIIDPVADYADLMESLFDFRAIRKMFENGFTLCFDAMHAITGPYAKHILENTLCAKKGSVINGVPLSDFGGGHPDPSPEYAKELFEIMFSDKAPDFGAASDGDGDRYIVLGKQTYVSPSDSLAILAANAHLAPQFANGVVGVARSMPTSRAVDRVASALNILSYETPTGWKFFGNLLDAGLINLCGEESAGTSSDHVREKDGLWAVLLWLNILATRQLSIANILQEHWEMYGRNYYVRHDIEAIQPEKAKAVVTHLETQIPKLTGQSFSGITITDAYVFSYTDSIDHSVSGNQGWCIEFGDTDRIVMRMSGTGTTGITLRFYIESYEADPKLVNKSPHIALESLRQAALELTDIERLTGRTLDKKQDL